MIRFEVLSELRVRDSLKETRWSNPKDEGLETTPTIYGMASFFTKKRDIKYNNSNNNLYLWKKEYIMTTIVTNVSEAIKNLKRLTDDVVDSGNHVSI